MNLKQVLGKLTHLPRIFNMRVQITVVAIAVMLVGTQNREALADLQSSTQNRAGDIVTPETTLKIEEGYAKYGDYLKATGSIHFWQKYSNGK